MGVKLPEGSAPIDGNAFAEAHRQLLADPTIQFDLPQPDPPPQAPSWLGALGPVLQAIFWLALAGFVLFILYLLVRRLSGRDWSWRRRRAEAEAPDESWRPEAGEARELLGEADALAAKGLFSEAARLILHRSIEDIDDKRPDLVRPALTSRDIAGHPLLPRGPAAAFARIAALVERSLFARRPLGADDWADCRAAYRDFAFADGWRG